jgi:hypothetical protein
MAVLGDDRLVQFSDGGIPTTLHVTAEDEFTVHSLIQLITYFPGRLSKQDFWPEQAAEA